MSKYKILNHEIKPSKPKSYNEIHFNYLKGIGFYRLWRWDREDSLNFKLIIRKEGK